MFSTLILLRHKQKQKTLLFIGTSRSSKLIKRSRRQQLISESKDLPDGVKPDKLGWVRMRKGGVGVLKLTQAARLINNSHKKVKIRG